MTTKERILFGTLIGSFVAASAAGQILMREYDKVTSERADLYSQIAYLINVMAQKGIEVEVFNGLAVVMRNTNNES